MILFEIQITQNGYFPAAEDAYWSLHGTQMTQKGYFKYIENAEK